MRKSIVAVSVVALLLPLATTAPAAAADPRRARIGTARIASGLSSPVAMAAPNDGSGRLMFVEQAGRIRVWTPANGLLSTPYLDIRSRVRSGGERGLLGLAFHPRFRENGYFFVHYTDGQGDIRISRFRATPTANRASAGSESVILEVPHRTYANHNAGALTFGKDSYLYGAVGDGGGQRDPGGNAQNYRTLLGKVFRIDVNRTCGTKRYCIPPTNPYAKSTTRRKEIWHAGLRNPWRFSIDRYNGNLWIGDVGEKAAEEINVSRAGRGGLNFGWDCREGSSSTGFGGSYCSGRTFTGPLYKYAHSGGRCAITGGFVYRGSRWSTLLNGVYVYGDYCTGEVWGLGKSSSGAWVNSRMYDHPTAVTSFGEDARGELYLLDYEGKAYRITASAR